MNYRYTIPLENTTIRPIWNDMDVFLSNSDLREWFESIDGEYETFLDPFGKNGLAFKRVTLIFKTDDHLMMFKLKYL
jgi:hypothetical protein